jgi:hypothetical protein
MGRLGWAGVRWGLGLAAITALLLPPLSAEAQRAAAPQPVPVTSLFSVRIGGYVQTNVTWDSDETGDDAPSSFRQFAVERGADEEDRETLRWAATRTRLFIDVRGPEMWGARSRAYTEFDWDGLKTNATAAHTPRLRHAYARFDWPSAYLTIGQTTLIFNSAVSSESEVESVSSAHGDITGGSDNRTPQVILGYAIPLEPFTLEVAGAVGRHRISRDQVGASVTDSGSRSAIPAVQGMVKGGYRLYGRDAVLAVSGYWGEETLTEGSTFKDANSEGLAVELLLPLPGIPGITPDIRGAWFTARNMAGWNLGNSNDGLTTDDPTLNPREISATGWWVEGNIGLPGNFGVGAGYGTVEDDRDDVIRIGGTVVQPQDNEAWWLFGQWSSGPVLAEVLYGRIDTAYLVPSTRAEQDSHSNALHLVFRYRF